jgi:hypothetical protein
MSDEQHTERDEEAQDASEDLELADEDAEDVVGGAATDSWNWRK